MKLKKNKLLIILFIALLGCIGCNDNEDKSPLKDKQLTVLEMNAEGCKENLKSIEAEQYIELKAEGESQLRIKFINATINCAGLDTTYAVIYDGILKVTFFDYNLANCLCDFDLECVLDSMENRQYELEVYANGEEPKAKITFIYSSKLDSKIDINN